MASCITDRMHWLIYLENESCFPWKLCTPKTPLVTYCKHTAQYWSQKTWKSASKSICSNCVYIPNFRQTEHLCCVPVEDLPQFIARSRFESAGCDRSVSVNVITHTFAGLKCLTETKIQILCDHVSHTRSHTVEMGCQMVQLLSAHIVGPTMCVNLTLAYDQ